MIHRLAMEAGDVFSACVCVAGKMPLKIWEKRNKVNKVSFFQITGEKDEAVPQKANGSSGYSKDPAIEEVVEYWALSNGLYESGSEKAGEKGILTKYSAENKSAQVWNLFIKDGRHSWPEKSVTGIDLNSVILDFFAGR